MLSRIDKKEFHVLKTERQDSCNILTAECRLSQRISVWYEKPAYLELDAAFEVLSQEFFRAIIPQQMKTLLVYDSNKKEHYVYSEQVKQFTTLNSLSSSNAIDLKKSHGLGQLLIAALFLMENDLHDENIGVNEQLQFVKIDGGECLQMAYQSVGKMKLSSQLFEHLPFLKIQNYTVNNWLDTIVWGKDNPNLSYFQKHVYDKARFGQEMREAMRHILLLPKIFMQELCRLCLPKDLAEKILAILLKRQAELKQIVLSHDYFDENFRLKFKYSDLAAIKKHLCHFKIQENIPVIKEQDVKEFDTQFFECLQGLNTSKHRLFKATEFHVSSTYITQSYHKI